MDDFKVVGKVPVVMKRFTIEKIVLRWKSSLVQYLCTGVYLYIFILDVLSVNKINRFQSHKMSKG